MRKISLSLFLVLLVSFAYAQQAKYVFFFIGDGMGVNQVQGTELFRGELEGRIGLKPLEFAQFPSATTCATYSATAGVTDSAAGGTALATGKKTKNGTIGMEKDQQTSVSSVASWAKAKGCRVGIATSVSVDHATPAAFYAHNPNRSNYYEIGKDLYTAGFDFYAGSDFLDPDKKGTSESLYAMAGKNGYTIARGIADFQTKKNDAEKLILFQTEAASKIDRNSIPYAIDRKEGDLTLTDITRSAIQFMSKDLSKGFFLMIEGGKIDWACHSNDAATAFREVEDLNNAIKEAYAFYTILNQLRTETGNKVSWEQVEQALRTNFGFWDKVKLTSEQEKRLREVYDRTFTGAQVKLEKSEYAQDEPLASEAKRIINEIALVGWVSGGHSAGYVPVFAIGAGAELFQGRMDNIEIPVRIAQAGGYK